jgi:E3 Ubiquitin ligase
MLIGGLVLIGIAAGLLWFAQTRRKLHAEVSGTETSTCGDLDQLRRQVAGEAGAGQFRQRCELAGNAQPEAQPVKAPFSGQDAVWYRTKVTHHYRERVRRKRGSDYVTDWDDRTRVVAEEESQTPFQLDDGTGRVLVDPRDAKLDEIEESFDRFEPDPGGSGGSVEFLGLKIQTTSGSESVGFQREEWIIRPNRRLYVLGEVSDSSGRLQVSKPSEGRFLISTRSEEEIAAGAKKAVTYSTIGAAVAGVAGVVLVVLGILA